MELEYRFELAETEFKELAQGMDWAVSSVTDLTMGPSGATSMQTDHWIVRLRNRDNKVRMEYKAPANSDWSAWVEYGIEIDDLPEAVRLLRAIGLRPGLLIDRVRRTSRNGAVTCSLDDVVGLGYFIELEVDVTETEEREGWALLESTREQFGLAERPTERPYGELMLERIGLDEAFREQQNKLIEDLLRQRVLQP
jgi:predicted adenylyl cyclase CyaB